MEPILIYGNLSLTLIEIILAIALTLLGAIIGLFLSGKDARAATKLSALQMQEHQKEAQILREQLISMSETQTQLQGRLAQFAEDSAKRETNLQNTLNERLDKVTERVGLSLSTNQEKNTANLKHLHERLALIDRAQKNIENLSGEVTGLQQLLSNKQMRGTFGEKQMQDMISDYLPPKNYRFQTTLSNGKRVDAVIDLPRGQGQLSIDSKFPLESWRRMDCATCDTDRESAKRDFIRDIKAHIKAISEKYLIDRETHDVALLFLPSEAIYNDLHSEFSDLIDESFKKRVMIVSPTSFMAILHSINALMRDVKMREQAHIIQAEVTKMAKDVGLLDDRVAKLQKHFDLTAKDIKDIRISTGKITKTAAKIDKLDMDETTDQTSLSDHTNLLDDSSGFHKKVG